MKYNERYDEVDFFESYIREAQQKTIKDTEPFWKDFPPMPAKLILICAIQGWAAHQGLRMQGIPALPERKAFIPAFIKILCQHRWRRIFEPLALDALRGDPDEEYVGNMLKQLLNRPDCYEAIVEALAEFAA